MSREPHSVLERLLRDLELGWMITLFEPPDRAIPDLMDRLELAAGEYRARIEAAVPFTPEALVVEAEANPHKVRAFLQALATSRSADMLVMVWRILQGLNIHEVSMEYREVESFKLDVTLARPGNGQADLERYQSLDISDAALVRHFGITKVDGLPLFDGFFPKR